ncbi:PREDICTED: N-acetyllactosaminide beta-1,3-N-acetylglucosaminyltransferase 3 [Crocodylus porosus]|uniref:N-acetyllactosaminide beta-1,3-N-acetylglucosaminyltransferase 3 n=1 Tax=Crocodylus porosus TaxID=8502 RepID=UPI00093CE696|nr:PREDICTED: N-acetyllactosaminide beta-1,3-N-acetylglucosaminyltransferase 3 [Crocodylus porosus]
MPRGCQKLEAVVLVTVGTAALLFLLRTTGNSSVPWQAGEPAVTPSAQPSPEPTLVSPRPTPVCRENASVANLSGFAGLPAHVKDFLRYRHCREFPQVLDVPGKCGGPEASRGVFLILAIKSAPANYERREIIRKTWGAERTYAGARIRRVFLVGTVLDPREASKLDQLLQLEAAEHGDVLQWRFVDSFFNLTLKQVLFHTWLEARCPGVRFVFNGDDDVFAHTDNIVHYLQGMGDEGSERHLFVGQLITNVGPVRAKWSKYYVPEQVTAAKLYPPYCGGGGLVMSGFTTHAIYRESLNIEVFPIDDVYLGMCLEKAGLVPASHMGIRTVGFHLPSAKLAAFDPCYYKELLLVHRFVPYEMLVMWRALHQPGLKCGRNLEVYRND